MALTGTLSMTYPAIVPVTGIALNKSVLTLNVNTAEQLTAAVLPENATNKNYTWTTSNAAVATVNNGLVTGIAAGQATITVTTEDGGFSATCTVTVNKVLSSDATLAELTIYPGILMPAFSPDITEYTVDVAEYVGAVFVSAVASDSRARIGGVGTMWLDEGENVFTVTVTAENGDSKIYTVTVNRAAPTVIAVTGVSLNKTSLVMETGNSEQLTATVLPTDADNQNVSWSSSDETVATVSAIGLITATGAGMATITITTEEGGFTATCSVEVSESVTVEAKEEEPVGEDGKGKIILSLTIPANSLFSGSFLLTLPDGMHLDLTATHLIDTLQSVLSLTIVQNANGSWLFTIMPLGLRSATGGLVYSQIVEIGYTVDKTVAEGTYEALISDLLFNFDNGVTIKQDELPVNITVKAFNGIPGLNAETFAYIYNGSLYIQSPVTETVQVYAANGVLLYNFQKQAGKVSYSINQPKGAVLIVKGGSGWTRKGIKN
jgi:uncharacterized protein YjdB